VIPELLHGLRAFVTFVVLPCLPERYRKLWPWDAPISISTLGLISGATHLLASAIVLCIVFMYHQEAFSSDVTDTLVNPDGTGQPGPVTWYGMVGFFTFTFTLKGLLLEIWTIDSLIRFYHASVTSTPLGSVFFSAPLYLFDRLRGWLESSRMTSRYGRADQPDRIVQEGDGLLLRSTRPHPNWGRLTAFSRGDSFYRLVSSGEGTVDGRPCFEYRLSPWPANDVIREIVPLDDAVELPASSIEDRARHHPHPVSRLRQ